MFARRGTVRSTCSSFDADAMKYLSLASERKKVFSLPAPNENSLRFWRRLGFKAKALRTRLPTELSTALKEGFEWLRSMSYEIKDRLTFICCWPSQVKRQVLQ
jgi:hypothetical protein